MVTFFSEINPVPFGIIYSQFTDSFTHRLAIAKICIAFNFLQPEQNFRFGPEILYFFLAICQIL